jgi:hypothetical protein
MKLNWFFNALEAEDLELYNITLLASFFFYGTL